MAGKIIADTIETGAGADIPTSYVVNGSAKAWVNFNGTGTIAARSSAGVSSLADDGTGDYTVNFTNAMLNSNYAVKGTVQNTTYPARVNSLQPTTYAASSISVNCITNNASYGSLFDQDYVNTALLGDLA